MGVRHSRGGGGMLPRILSLRNHFLVHAESQFVGGRSAVAGGGILNWQQGFCMLRLSYCVLQYCLILFIM